ncbi:MAG: hypothetical protein L3J23_06490 [Flavobacteriaceae bacterium]|nr:hypothetical protein [Flavobacteriaceae bacterium]
MNLALYILLALVLIAVVAYIIVNFVPKKLHWLLSLVLLALIVLLSFKIIGSIMKPIKFAKEKKVKYTKVIANLKMIRDAQVAYNKKNGRYTADKSALIAFVDTGKLPITEVKTEIKKINRGGGIVIDKEIRVEKIVGYTNVRKDFAGRDYKNMFKVPGTKKMFDIKIDSVEKVDGIQSSVFLAQVDKADILLGMDAYLIQEEKEAIGGTQVKGKFISVGSLTDVKVTGNWPPIYDGKKVKVKE